MTRIPRWIGVTVAAMAISTLAATAADWDVDLRGGFYAKEAEGIFIGGGALGNLGNQWFINPNIELAFGDKVDYVTLNGDVHYDFHAQGNLSFWAGGGLAIVHTSPDHGDDETDLGLNLLVGLGKKKGNVRPFGQLKLIVSAETEVVLAGGVRF